MSLYPIQRNDRFPNALHLAPPADRHTEGFIIGKYGFSLACGRTALLTEIPLDDIESIENGDLQRLDRYLSPTERRDQYRPQDCKAAIVGAPYESLRVNPELLIVVKSGLSDIGRL